MKMVIYKSLGKFCVTTLENFNAKIKDARKIQVLDDFESPGQIVNYYCKWFKSKPEDFIIMEGKKIKRGYYQDFIYCTLDNGTAEIIRCTKSLSTTDLKIPSIIDTYTVTSIGSWAFSDYKSKSITIPDSVTSIGNGAFEYCENLTNITIPDSVTSIGDCAFEACKSLTSITIPDSVTSIGSWAFRDCTNLTSVTIPSSVTNIGETAFCDCKNLKNVIIPDSVTSIGEWAFRGCTSLENITIPDSVTSIGEEAFSECESLTNIEVNEKNTSYSSLNGNLYNKNKTELLQYAMGKTDTSFTIPDSVTNIGDYAFCNCINLESITIPDSITSMGFEAFKNSPVKIECGGK